MQLTKLAIAFVLLFANLAEASEYYVAPNGSDGNDGSEGAPFKTFDPALALAVPGDTIYARGGTYDVDNSVSYTHDFGSSRTFLNISDHTGVADGTADAPILVRNYPGEYPVLDASGVSTVAAYFFEKSFWVLSGFEMIGGGILIQGSDGNRVHDITIEGNHIHDVDAGNDGDNTGMIVVYRGDTSGPSRIFVRNNLIHGNSRHGMPWDTMSDPEHTAALTVLSECGYNGVPEDCTGSIEFSGNTVYEVPQLFFFKNTMVGPVAIYDNVFHDARTMGIFHTADAHIHNNLFYNIRAGADFGGDSDFASDDIRAIDGKNAVIENNTFVGLESGFNIFVGSGHLIQRNIFFGLQGRTSGAGWDTPAFLTRSNAHADPADVGQSVLQGMDSDLNCFITESADLLMVKRQVPGGGPSEYYDREGALATFGFDSNSVFLTGTDPTAFFVDPGARDYNLLEGSPCESLSAGAEAPIDSSPVSVSENTEGGGGLSPSSGCEASKNAAALVIALVFLMLERLVQFRTDRNRRVQNF